MSSSYHHFNDDDDDDDPNNREQYKQIEIREAITFLIDITPNLLKPQNELNQTSQLKEILTSINELMQELIINSRNTGIGIYFYNCATIKPLKNLGLPTFNSLFGLNVLNLTNMIRLNDLLVNNEDLSTIFKYKPMEEESELNSILSKMINQFTGKKEFNKRRMIWITNNDQPFKKESTLENLKRSIDDFDGFGFKIDPIFISYDPSSPFKFDKFIDIFSNTNFLKVDEYKEDKKIKLEPSNGTNGFDSTTSSKTRNSMYQQPILSNQIKKRILNIQNIKRVQFSCSLILSDNGSIGGNLGCNIKGYTLYSHEKIKKSEIQLYTKNEEIKKVYIDSDLIDANNQTKIEMKKDRNLSLSERKQESGIMKGFELGGDNDVLLLNQEQLEFIRNFTFDHRLKNDDTKKVKKEDEIEFPDDIENEDDDNTISLSYSKAPYLKVIGFRDLEHFNPSYICSTPVFISADLYNGFNTTISSKQGGFTNSLKTFASLYRSTLKLKQYIVVVGCIRSNSKPHLYAMYPTQTFGSNRLKEEINLPQGFLLCKLPWVDDFRSLPSNYIQYVNKEEPKINQPLVEDFKNLIKNFEIDSYDPKNYPNPSLNYYYKVIKHELLQLPFLPTNRLLAKNDETFKQLISIKKNLTPENHQLIKEILSKIQKLTEDITSQEKESHIPPPPKTKKFIKEITIEEVLIAWKNNNLNNFNMDQLKQFRKNHYPDIKPAVKKIDMINNISEYLESNVKN
ncbi:KU70 [Candida jiufengensis]|uniref:KU70 n=1 Tax=Candida jiufengensis TaxID=497108 RepID=UPI0022247387|nr:KU70 [Candida jiufengensis]KAI5951141.1 KU70 [Candida jiufengensis]